MTFDEHAAHKTPTEPYAPPPRRAPSWLGPTVSGIVLLAVVAVVVARLALSTPRAPDKQTSTTADSPLALDPAAYGMACVEGAAWSPDSAKIAILGTRQSCAESNPDNFYPTVVVIVNAKNGQSLNSLQPDAMVLNHFHLHMPQAGAQIIGPDSSGADGDLIQPGVLYDSPVWSPDGKSVALPFSFAYLATPPGGGSLATQRITVSGCYVSAVTGAAGGSGAVAFGVTLNQDLPYVAEWNVKTGKPVVSSTSLGPAMQEGTTAQLEPASLRYSWRSDGSLAGSGALTTTKPPAPASLGPVGNPDGGASFTVWQGMDVQVDADIPQNPQAPAAFRAESHFLAWSPDGTYLLSASYAWRVQPSKQPIPSATQLQRVGAADLPYMPIRDAAMDAMLSPQPGTHPNTFPSNTFTWSPDGKMLAAIANGGATMISADVTVLIVDCASGKTLTTLQANSASAAYGNIASLQWSPDGKQLLIGAESEYFVFGPGTLPQK
jgi:hypothetical protein